ncbi:MAG TPA: protoporphyrinogen oxidase [Acidobacteriaceae bacterium]|nr:protoporphyrinogen oxidase [Acidobacteriaceae bacterium]
MSSSSRNSSSSHLSRQGKPGRQTDSRKIAIVGGGISGLSAAYELARRGAEFILFEASGRLGGILETFRFGDFVIECGPDSWVSEKPWAHELAVELGLEDQILGSNDQWRRTYLVREGKLQPLPDGMRMMVPVKWAPILESPLFSWQARLGYLREPKRAEELKAAAAGRNDESVAEFVRRHFGQEVSDTIAGPLLSGVFGGDVERLSVRAVMPAFVKMEAEHGSLITALQSRAEESAARKPIFSSLRTGLETLVDRLAAHLPSHSVHLHEPATAIRREEERWFLNTQKGEQRFDSIVLATPPHVTQGLFLSLPGEGRRMAGLLPQRASSAIVVALAFDPAQSSRMRIPRGFGFLTVSPLLNPAREKGPSGPGGKLQLLACTFVDQKFSHRAPSGGILLRAFFGGESAEAHLNEPDEALVSLAHRELTRIVGPLPASDITLVRRWPLSLPQYEVGHVERIAELESLAASHPGLHLAGNAYHGVGLPDLIRDGRAAARAAIESCDARRL